MNIPIESLNLLTLNVGFARHHADWNWQGVSPIRYVNRKKVERAQLMLMTEPIHVKEVAFRLGFDDHSYFIRLFKKVTGLPPNDYRQRYGYKK